MVVVMVVVVENKGERRVIVNGEKGRGVRRQE